MYSRAKGKAKSKTPKKLDHKWITYSKEEIEKIIIKLAKEGKKQSEIGMILRDLYGIPKVKEITKETLSQTLKKNEAYPELPEDLSSLIKKHIMIIKHYEKNHKDQTAKRGIKLTQSKIQRLIKYYKKTKVLPADWKYNEAQARLIVG